MPTAKRRGRVIKRQVTKAREASRQRAAWERWHRENPGWSIPPVK